MLTYHDLSKAQKRWVELVEACYPDIGDEISYQDVQAIHEFFASKRAENPKYKISKALWLITNNALSRGVYKFPRSDAVDAEVVLEIDSELETQYKAELEKLGIPFKKAK
jgi:hypothetical protein